MTDHRMICEQVYRYALGLDTRNWPLYRSIFTDEIDADFSSYHGRPAVHMRADDWVASARKLFAGFAATQHTMSNPIVEVDGDRAVCTMYMQAVHSVEPGDDAAWFTMAGYYSDTLVRSGGGWLLDGVTLNILWLRGDRSIMKTAAVRGAAAMAPQQGV